MKVLNVRCHVGAQIGAQVYTSIDSKKTGFEMNMTKEGVFVTGKGIGPTFIPHGTIASVSLDPEGFAEFANKPMEEKKTKTK